MSDRIVVLVTGASSGNGQATSRLLAQKGYQVFGTSRNPSTAKVSSNVEMLALDVCEDDSVIACIKTISEQAGHLDVLVNNAGIVFAGAVEELSLDEAKAQFDTNFFGAVRMVKAVLPMMRQQKHGRIVNISSLAGLSPVPFLGMYSASKYALEGYTETLHHEVMPFNIYVSMVEAGFLKTPMKDHRQVAEQQISAYDPWRQRALAAIGEFEEKGPGPELIAETVLNILEDPAPRLRYIVGKEAKSISRMKRLLPEGMYNQGLRRSFRLDK